MTYAFQPNMNVVTHVCRCGCPHSLLMYACVCECVCVHALLMYTCVCVCLLVYSCTHVCVSARIAHVRMCVCVHAETGQQAQARWCSGSAPQLSRPSLHTTESSWTTECYVWILMTDVCRYCLRARGERRSVPCCEGGLWWSVHLCVLV